MVDFNPAFANAGPKREPTSDEITNGFPCGPADRELFNWLIYASQTEFDAVISKSGLTASNADLTQLAQAVRSQALNYRVAGGTANALTVTLDPAPASLAALTGTPIRIKIAATNTGAATLNVNGLGAKPLTRPSGAPVIAGDMAAGQIIEVIYNGLSFQLTGMTQLAQGGRTVFATAGTSNWTVPAGVFRIFVRVWGGGGGGGGVYGGSTPGGAAGGAGGGYAEGWFAVTPGQVIAMAIAAAALGGGYGGIGDNGGTCSAAGLCSATGGTGGQGATSNYPTPATTPGSGVGGQVNLTGIGGWTAFSSDSGKIGGVGGSSPLGGGITFGAVNGAGFAGQFPGGGGSGGSAGSSIGGNGALGQIVIEW